MITKKTLVQQYGRYLDLIKREEDCSKLVVYFSNCKKLLYEKCEDSALATTLELDSIYKLLVQVRERNIMLKNLAWKWNHDAVQECYRLLKLIKSVPYEVNEEQYMVNEAKLFRLINEQEDMAMQLYLYFLHWKEPDGKRLYESSRGVVEKLLKARSDEEIDEILHPGENRAETSTPLTESEVLEEAVAAIPAVEV